MPASLPCPGRERGDALLIRAADIRRQIDYLLDGRRDLEAGPRLAA
jgi:hypothetical protein